MLAFVKHINELIFGSFERIERIKLIKMGFILGFVLCSYTTLAALKTSVFCNLINQEALPRAKFFWFLVSIPIFLAYSKFVTSERRSKTFFSISRFYSFLLAVFALLLALPLFNQAHEHVHVPLFHILYGYSWFVAVECYGALAIVLFWSIATDIMKPSVAQQGFFLITAIAQFGAIAGPIAITKLPRFLGLSSNFISIIACAFFTLLSALLMRNLFRTIPSHFLIPYTARKTENQSGTSIISRLKNPYIIVIFLTVVFYVFLMTVFDYQFSVKAARTYSGVHLGEYLGSYFGIINIGTFLTLILGVSNIPKLFGNAIGLAISPLFFAVSICAFAFLDNLTALAGILVGSKIISISLNKPIIKQLYIPTTKPTRYVVNAWIENFGASGATALGSLYNMFYDPPKESFKNIILQFLLSNITLCLGLTIVAVWFYFSFYLVNTYNKAIKNKEFIC